MARLFRAAPEAIDETLHLLDRCNFSLDELKYEYPDETREGYATPQEALVAFDRGGRAPALSGRHSATRCAPPSTTNSR